MTDREAFKFGFLMRCADEGLSPAQTQERIKLANLGSQLMGAAVGLPAVAAVGGLGLAAAGGAGAGHLMAKATEPEMDAEDAKLQELIAAYRQQTDQARRQAARVSYRTQSRPPRGRGFSPVVA